MITLRAEGGVYIFYTCRRLAMTSVSLLLCGMGADDDKSGRSAKVVFATEVEDRGPTCCACFDLIPNLWVVNQAHRKETFQWAQFSVESPAMRPNSRRLLLTRINPEASACAAIHGSLPPMGVPARSNSARTRA